MATLITILYVLLALALVALLVFLVSGIALIFYIRKHVKNVAGHAHETLLHIKGDSRGPLSAIVRLPLLGFIIRKIVTRFLL